MYSKYSEESILNYAQKLENSCLRDSASIEYDIFKGKGSLGQLVEKAFFQYEPNSNQEADFKEVGLELKVAPLKVIKKVKSSDLLIKRLGRSAKERIVITMIDYDKLAKESWEEASVKNKMRLLLMLYLYDNSVPVDEQIFELVDIWEPSKDDLLVIEKDWHDIQKKILDGRAHEISEGDTNYLGACTKGVNRNSVRQQPYSKVSARQRAFSFKRNYVDYIVEELLQKRKNIKTKQQSEEISVAEAKATYSCKQTFYDKLEVELNNNIGLSIEQLNTKYNNNRSRNAKNYINLVVKDYISEIIGMPFSQIAELKKSGIEIKCILLQPNMIPKEAMSFEQIDYCEIVLEDWESSTIRDKFENKKHLWVVFMATRMYSRQNDLKLSEIEFYRTFYWNMPIVDLEVHYRELWEDTVTKIIQGNYDSFMKSKDNSVGHIRPKGKNKKDKAMTPQGRQVRKKCFWLNSNYIAEQIKGRVAK